MTHLTLRRLTPADWATYRDLRLAALADAPHAFGTTLAEAEALTEADWRERLDARVQFVGTTGDVPTGTAGALRQAAGADLVSMWVRPDNRGRGVGEGLVGAVAAWARAQRLCEVRLWVTGGNEPAERLYRRCGFARTGAVQPVVPGDPGRLEHEMVRLL